VKKRSGEGRPDRPGVGRTSCSFTQVRAPFPGVVVKRYRSLGGLRVGRYTGPQYVQPDLLYVTANLEETRLTG